MYIQCTNIHTTGDCTNMARSDLRIALIADVEISGTIPVQRILLPKAPIIWLLENLVEAFDAILKGGSQEHTFYDFYGEFEIDVRRVQGNKIAVSEKPRKSEIVVGHQEVKECILELIEQQFAAIERALPELSGNPEYGFLRAAVIEAAQGTVAGSETPKKANDEPNPSP